MRETDHEANKNNMEKQSLENNDGSQKKNDNPFHNSADSEEITNSILNLTSVVGKSLESIKLNEMILKDLMNLGFKLFEKMNQDCNKDD